MGFIADMKAAVLAHSSPTQAETGQDDADPVASSSPRRKGRLHVLPNSRGKSIFAITCQEKDDAYKAAEYLVAGSAIFVNLQEIDRAQGQRIVDVLSGVAFGIGGMSQPTGDRIFHFLPHDFSLTLDDKSQLAESGLFAEGFDQGLNDRPPKPMLDDEPPAELRTGLFGRAGFGPRVEV